MPRESQTPVAADGGVRSVARAVDVLSLFDEDHPSRPLREVVRLAGLPKTTVVRLLSTLEALGLVAQAAESTYTVGPVFLRWVKLADSLWEVSVEAREVMSRLVDECGETVNVYIRRDLTRVCIAQVEGTTTVRSVVEVGVPYPLSAGASAQVLLGDATGSDVLLALTEDSAISLDSLAREVAGVREAGFAVTHGQRELGASAVAAPIVGHDGRILAALSASGPTSRFTADRVGAYVDAVTAAAREISQIGLGSVEAFL